MVDRPILFSAPMVRALLDGRKTQTRRLIAGAGWHCDPAPGGGFRWVADGGAPSMPAKVRWCVGDRLWVREAWRTLQKWDDLKPRHVMDDFDKIDFEAGGFKRNPLWAWGKKRSPLYLPRWASRLTLIVEKVRVQRVQDISEEDAKAEGAPYDDGTDFPVEKAPPGARHIEDGWDCARDWYADLWNSLLGEGAFEASPWVAAITFRVIRANIDSETVND